MQQPATGTKKDSTATIGIKADIGPEHADTFRHVQPPDHLVLR